MKLILIGAAAMLAAVTLSGCGTTTGGSSPGGAPTVANDVNDLVTFTKADLDAAEANAVATNDTVAAPCYPALEQWIGSVAGTAGQLQVKGLFSGAEAGRAVVNGVDQGIPDYVYKGCGPLYLRVHAEVASKGLKAALLLH